MDLKKYLKNLDKVIYQYSFNWNEVHFIPCKVVDVNINKYYFEEKREPIFIEVNLEPLNHKDIDLVNNIEDFNNVSLDLILRY